MGHSLELIFSRLVNRLPSDSRSLIALAATEPSASQATLWRAAAQLGIDPDVASSNVGTWWRSVPRSRFVTLMVCSLAYHLTPVPQREPTDQALADEAEERIGPRGISVWPASGPDEAVASRLEETAERARQRGGYAATVSSLVEAAELSVSPNLRIRRLLAATEAALVVGQWSGPGHCSTWPKWGRRRATGSYGPAPERRGVRRHRPHRRRRPSAPGRCQTAHAH